MILMIDNYDSFTYNLVQYLREMAADVQVFRNDAITLAEIEKIAPSAIVISPGPGRPEDAGVSCDAIRAFAGKIPLLGVCLGHQAMGLVFGGQVVHAKKLMHGKVSEVSCDGQGIFKGLDSRPFKAMRYHSLALAPESLPDCLEVTAWTDNDDGSRRRRRNHGHPPQAVRRRRHPVPPRIHHDPRRQAHPAEFPQEFRDRRGHLNIGH